MKKTKKANAQSKKRTKTTRAVGAKTTSAKIASAPAVERTTSMASTKTTVVPRTPFGWMVMIFGVLFIAHSLVLYLASMFFPEAVVLGTNLISPLMALLYSMFVFTLIVVGAMPIIEAYESSQKSSLGTVGWMAVYFVLNFVGLWIVARFAEMLGLGIASWRVIAMLALVLDFVQGFVVTSMMKQMK